MQIRIRKTGAVMYEDELRSYIKANGGPTWGATTSEVLDFLGADVIFEGPQAQPERYQFAFRDGVEQVEGNWYTKYSVADMNQEAKNALDTTQAEDMRKQRNIKLAESDWTQMADAPVSKAAWVAYRQALRNITAQAGFPWAIDWPTQPE
jgi:hypothetical protein